jgi:hypothetical protein
LPQLWFLDLSFANVRYGADRDFPEGSRKGRQIALARRPIPTYPIVGITNSASARMPVGPPTARLSIGEGRAREGYGATLGETGEGKPTRTKVLEAGGVDLDPVPVR